jgi:hypothetical protein
MKYALSLVLGGGLVLALLGAVAWVIPGWVAAVGLDVWNLPALTLQIAEERQREEQLLAEDAAVLAYIRGRDELITAVSERRLTLREAAGRCHELALAVPVFRWDDFRALHPGNSDEECHCRDILAGVVQKLSNQPERSRQVIQALEAELRGPQAQRAPRLPLPPGGSGQAGAGGWPVNLKDQAVRLPLVGPVDASAPR